jgi:hypothetical protein
VSAGSRRRGVMELQPHEVFDLSWLASMQEVRYLHIKAYQHINVKTLQYLCLLPADAQLLQTAPQPSPLFVRRVEFFGLDVFEEKVALSLAAEFTFHAWTNLRRCACQYMALGISPDSFSPDVQHVSPQYQEANAVLRQRVGAERWITEKQLIAARYDQRWQVQMAAQL